MNIKELKEQARLTPEETTAIIDQWLDGQMDAPHVSEAIAEAQLNKLLNLPLYFKIEKPLPEAPYKDRGGYDDTAHTIGYRRCQQDMLQWEKESYIPTGETK